MINEFAGEETQAGSIGVAANFKQGRENRI